MGKSLNKLLEAGFVPRRTITCYMEMDLRMILEISCALETNMPIVCIFNDDSRIYYHHTVERIVVIKDFVSGKGFQWKFSSWHV